MLLGGAFQENLLYFLSPCVRPLRQEEAQASTGRLRPWGEYIRREQGSGAGLTAASLTVIIGFNFPVPSYAPITQPLPHQLPWVKRSQQPGDAQRLCCH